MRDFRKLARKCKFATDPHYGLPAFPALGIVVGKFGGDALQALDRFVEAMFSTDVYSRMVQPQGDSYAMLLLGKLILLFQSGWLILWLGAMSTLIFGVRRNLRLAFGCFLLMAIVLLVIVGKMLSLAGEYRSVKSLAAMLLERLGPADLVIHEGPLENSAGLTFYTGRQIHVVDGRRGGLHFGSRFPDAAGLFLDGEGLWRHWQGPRRVFLVTDRPLEQSVLRLIPPQARRLVAPEGRQWLFTNRPE